MSRRPAGTPSSLKNPLASVVTSARPPATMAPGTGWPLALKTTPCTAPVVSITMLTAVVVSAMMLARVEPICPVGTSTATTS